jgi:pimeloyl-ACP methyl ester carboxylesterase
MVREHRLRAALALLAQAIACAAMHAQIVMTPAAVYSDPPKDAKHPARMETLQIMSHGSPMNAVFYMASGAEARPTVLFFHGSPGNEQNLDLVQAIRRAGWNVLTLHYRGSWGSGGTYSIQHCIEDSQIAISFLRDPATIAKYYLKPGQIVIAGHSLGGFLAAKAGSTDSSLMGVAIISGWDIGHDALGMPKWSAAQMEDEFGDMPGRVVGADGASIVAEAVSHERDWSFASFTNGLARNRVLIVTAHDDSRDSGLKLAADLKAKQGAVTTVDIDTDHPFSDSRIALETAVLVWLQALPGAPKAR